MKQLFLLLSILVISCAAPEETFTPKASNLYPSFTEDGAWCWFSDPRAIYSHDGVSKIVSGWVKKDGTIEAATMDFSSSEINLLELYPQLEKDDHDHPAFVELQNKTIMAFYAKHSKDSMYFHHLDFAKNAQNIPSPYSPISEKLLEKYPNNNVTYANPYTLSDENNRIYVFGRWTGFKPNMMWSDDGGKEFTESKIIISPKEWQRGNRPYVKYFSDGNSRIHLAFTNGHPRNEPLNSIYYAYYEKGAFWRIDGSQIATVENLPFEVEEATLVYKATENTGRSWVYDIALNKEKNPVILYARYPEEENHLYHYAEYKRGNWEDILICDSGRWFPETEAGKKEREPHYSGGMVLNPSITNEVFLSKQVKKIFEIEKYTLNEESKWISNPITSGSNFNNVRPYFPRNFRKGDTPILLWMENKYYIHYTNYDSAIKYVLNP